MKALFHISLAFKLAKNTFVYGPKSVAFKRALASIYLEFKCYKHCLQIYTELLDDTKNNFFSELTKIRRLESKIKEFSNFHYSKYEDFKVVVVAGEGFNAYDHIQKWIHIFSKYDKSTLFFVGDLGSLVYLSKKFPEKFFIFSNTVAIDNISNSIINVKYIYYLSNSVKTNRFIIANNNARHIMLGHGDSEKVASAHRIFKIYDEYWVAGQAQVDRFKKAKINMSAVELKIVGSAFIDIEHENDDEKEKYILYAPTWEGVTPRTSVSSLPLAQDILNVLLEFVDHNVYIKMHSATGKNLKSYKEIESKINKNFPENVVRKSNTIREMYYNCSALVCDISSVISEFLYFQRPIFIYNSNNANGYSESDIPAYKYCYCFSTARELKNLVSSVLINADDYLEDDRKSALNYFVDINKTKAKYIENLVANNYSEGC